MNYDWDFSFLLPYADAFLRGTLVTLRISSSAFLIGTVMGIPLGSLLRVKWFGHGVAFLNDSVRAVPMLVMLFLVYYFPANAFFGLQSPGAEVSAIVAFTITQAAYTGDLVRGAIDGVSRSAKEGGLAIGLTNHQLWRYIVIPDIIRQILPAEMAFFIGLVRLSSLASVIGAQEVVYVARVAVSQTFRSLEAWVVVALIYITLVLPLTYMVRALEKSTWLRRRG